MVRAIWNCGRAVKSLRPEGLSYRADFCAQNSAGGWIVGGGTGTYDGGEEKERVLTQSRRGRIEKNTESRDE